MWFHFKLALQALEMRKRREQRAMLKAQPALAECALSKFIRAFRLFKSKQGSSLEQLNL